MGLRNLCLAKTTPRRCSRNKAGVPARCSAGADDRGYFLLANTHLIEGLTIGATPRLIDGISSIKPSDPSGSICVLMPCMCVAEEAGEVRVGKATAPAVAV